jgi:hypothetical protein
MEVQNFACRGRIVLRRLPTNSNFSNGVIKIWRAAPTSG